MAAPAVEAAALLDEMMADPPTVAAAGADAAEVASPAAAEGSKEEGAKKSNKKRKVAVVFGYVGKGYNGMQRNPGVVTIEDEMEAAIHKAGGISDDNKGFFTKVHWMRAARTDKGVSAIGQVISLAARRHAHAPHPRAAAPRDRRAR